MKRQNSQQSCRQNQPERLHIGCMSGIFNFFCKYHSNRKSLTSGKRQQTNEVSCPKKSLQPVHSINLPRSPTLPAEIRCKDSPPPPLVARLMGLDDAPTPHITPESTAEKRRQILGALEKCEQDLKTIKKIIDVVRSAEQHKSPHSVDFDERVRMISERKQILDDEQSPVSVLDEFTLSPVKGGKLSKEELQGQMIHKQQQRKNLREESIFNISLYDKNRIERIQRHSREIESTPFGCSKAMVEAVNEVCGEIDCGEKREFGRIVLALQDFIYADLVEETVKEMGYPHMHSLPFDSCKRRLYF